MSIIELKKGDITQCEVDAIVNAANSRLAGGGGVDGAIHKGAGKELLQECQKIFNEQGECNPGNAVITSAYNLPAKYIIHAVGPIWHGGNTNEESLLAKAYLNSLELAQKYKCRSIAFPNISTGVYRFPKERAADIVLNTLMDYLTQRESFFEKIYLVCFDDENYKTYESRLHGTYTPSIPLVLKKS